MVIFERICRDLSFNNFFTKKNILLVVFLSANFGLMIYKLSVSHRILIFGNKNIYEQHVQSAKFLHTYYNDSKVVANDIGAVSYFTEIHLLDIVGLASVETIPYNGSEVMFDHRFKKFITKYTVNNNFDVAVVYEVWFNGQIPDHWRKAAELTISENVNAARTTVSIYSVNPENFNQLQQNIRNFKWNKNVQVVIK